MKENDFCITGTDGRGLTLRDYFAAKAMQTLLGNEHFMKELCGRINKSEQDADLRATLAEEAYDFADAMLAERSK